MNWGMQKRNGKQAEKCMKISRMNAVNPMYKNPNDLQIGSQCYSKSIVNRRVRTNVLSNVGICLIAFPCASMLREIPHPGRECLFEADH